MKKRYLSGFDWVMGAIDHVLKKTTSAGNTSLLVFIVEGPVDEERLSESINSFTGRFPVLRGRISRAANLAPYWKMPPEGTPCGLRLNIIPAGGSSALSIMEQCINRPFESENEHIEFHLIRPEGGGEYHLIVKFDHRLFDARGAESFMDLLQRHTLNGAGGDAAQGVSLESSADLKHWTRKFRAGRSLNQRVAAATKTPIRALPMPGDGPKRGFKFRLVCFDEEHTRRIYENAHREAGYLIEMPYLLAAALQGVHGLFKRRKINEPGYFIPVSLDKRTGRDIKEELFFNYASMLLFQVRAADVPEKPALITTLKQQLYEQVQSRLPENIQDASSLLRIAPFPVIRKFFGIPFKGKFASFCFSYVSKPSYLSTSISGALVKNIIHMPRPPSPPGLGVFFNSFGGLLNATISWLDGIITEEEAGGLEEDLRRRL